MIIGKLDTGELVEVTKVADRVAFSPERGWVCVTPHIAKPEFTKHAFKWLPATTRFEWVRKFDFTLSDSDSKNGSQCRPLAVS